MSFWVSQFTSGFNDWKHSQDLVASRENCSQHRDSTDDSCLRKAIIGRDNYNLVQQYENESQNWRKVLHIIVSIVQFLCERGLAFRDKDEVIGSASNGNYLGILELISNHDTFIVEHIQRHANKGRGHTSYLSSTVCEEVIELMGHKVLSTIINANKRATYSNTTPFLSILRQM